MRHSYDREASIEAGASARLTVAGSMPLRSLITQSRRADVIDLYNEKPDS